MLPTIFICFWRKCRNFLFVNLLKPFELLKYCDWNLKVYDLKFRGALFESRSVALSIAFLNFQIQRHHIMSFLICGHDGRYTDRDRDCDCECIESNCCTIDRFLELPDPNTQS